MSFADAMRATGGDAVAAAAMVFAEAPGDKRGADESFGDTNPADPKGHRSTLAQRQEALALMLRQYARRGSSGSVVTPRQLDMLLEDADEELLRTPYVAEDGKPYNILSYFIQEAAANKLPDDRASAMVRKLFHKGASIRSGFGGLPPLKAALQTDLGTGAITLFNLGAPLDLDDMNYINIHSKPNQTFDMAKARAWGDIYEKMGRPMRTLAGETRRLLIGYITPEQFKRGTSAITSSFWRLPFERERGEKPMHILEQLLRGWVHRPSGWSRPADFYQDKHDIVQYVVSKGALVNFGSKSAIDYIDADADDPRTVRLLLMHGATVGPRNLEDAREAVDRQRGILERAEWRADPASRSSGVTMTQQGAAAGVKNAAERLARAVEIYDMLWASVRRSTLELAARRSRLLREVPPEVQEMIMKYTERASQARM